LDIGIDETLVSVGEGKIVALARFLPQILMAATTQPDRARQVARRHPRPRHHCQPLDRR